MGVVDFYFYVNKAIFRGKLCNNQAKSMLQGVTMPQQISKVIIILKKQYLKGRHDFFMLSKREFEKSFPSSVNYGKVTTNSMHGVSKYYCLLVI